MDEQTVKMLLASYRSQEAADPMFAEALREAARHPGLAAWFEEMQRFDAVLAEKLREAPVPADVKARILADAHAAKFAPASHQRWAVPLTLAAVFCGALLVWRYFAPDPPSRALALQAISFTEEMPALQFVCFDAAAVAKWVNEQPGAQHLGLQLNQPAEALSMRMIGSSVVDWHGRPVTMICLQNGERMAMLYILTGADAGLPDGASETVEERGWTVRTIHTGGQVRVLTTKGRVKDGDFQVPF